MADTLTVTDNRTGKSYELPIQEVGKKDPRVLKENPERFSDPSLVKELDDSGFIDALYSTSGAR